MKIEFEGVKYDTVNGDPFDRGSADSYYGRRMDPHYWPSGTYKGYRVDEEDMSEKEIAEYYAGYKYNEELGDYKDWG